MSIFQRYIEARKMLKISQGEIAGAIGVTQSALSQQERLGNPNIKAMAYISITYNVDMNWVFTGEGKMIKSVLAGKTLRELEDKIMTLQTQCEGLQDQVLMLVRDKKNLENELEKKKAG